MKGFNTTIDMKINIFYIDSSFYEKQSLLKNKLELGIQFNSLDSSKNKFELITPFSIKLNPEIIFTI